MARPAQPTRWLSASIVKRSQAVGSGRPGLGSWPCSVRAVDREHLTSPLGDSVCSPVKREEQHVPHRALLQGPPETEDENVAVLRPIDFAVKVPMGA